MMVSEVDRIDRVVDGLLELARSRQLTIEPVSLGEVLSRAVAFVEAQARAHQVAVHILPADGTRKASCDREQMYQVALNLIVNAIQVLPPGRNIWLRTVADDDHVGFEVQDDGPGMSAEMQPHIFTPFFTKRRVAPDWASR